MGHRLVFCFKGVVAVLATMLIFTGPAFADTRPEVLERIKPVGTVAVEGQAAPAQASADAPVSAEAAPTEAAPTEAAPAEAAPEEVAAAPAPAAADSSDPAALAQAKGCLACHQIEIKVVGPAYKDVAAKYKGDAGAVDALVKKVKEGGVGAWGQIPMPPQVVATEEEIKLLVKWILSL